MIIDKLASTKLGYLLGMCFSAEASLVTTGVLVLMGLSMMVRGLPLDRILSGFILALAVIQLVEFGIHSKILGFEEGGRMLYLTLLAQCAILAAGVWAVYGGVTSTGLALVTCVVLAIGVVVSITSNFSSKPGPTIGCPLDLGPPDKKCRHLEWSKDGGPLLGDLGIWYLIGLFSPLVLVTLFAPTMTGVAVGLSLLLYGVFSALWVYINYPAAAFSSNWCAVSFIFAVGAWILGCFY